MMAMWKRKNRGVQQRIVTLVKRSVIAGENEVGCSEFKAILVNHYVLLFSIL